MANFPGVNVSVASGNLLREVAVADTVPCIVATVKTSSLIGKLQVVYTIADAEQYGYTAEKEPFMHGLLEEYYTEVAGKHKLYLLGTAETQTMADVLNPISTNGLKPALKQCNGEVTLVAIARHPAEGYEAGADFLDKDIDQAVKNGKLTAEALQKEGMPVRILIEGRVANGSKTNEYKPSEQGNGYVGIVLGGTKPDGSASVALALGRASKYPAHEKLGSGQNGQLAVGALYVGSTPIEARQDMDTLHDQGFITFHQRVGVAGRFFGRDNMCSDDDFKILAHGRIIDKAQRIVQKALAPSIETAVRVKDDGTIEDSEASYLENLAEMALLSGLGEQVSGVKVTIDRDELLVQSSTLKVDIKVLPLGYLTWIKVSLGLAASLN